MVKSAPLNVRCLDEDNVACPRTEQVNTVTPGHGFLTHAAKERVAREKEERAKLLEEKRTRIVQENLSRRKSRQLNGETRLSGWPST